MNTLLFMSNQRYTILIVTIFGILVVFGAIFLVPHSPAIDTEQSTGAVGYKNISYLIDGRRVQLKDGVSEVEAAPGSASKIITRYFGNELKDDLNDDGREDIVFLLTQETGGTGTFYYAVAALNMPQRYVGSDGYLLGDRIAPQTTELSQNPNQKHVIVVNYADRAPGEPMTTRPSVGKSAYLKLNPDTMQWAIVLSPEERKSL